MSSTGSSGSTESKFVHVDVEPSKASEDGVTLRFKRISDLTERAVSEVPYESEDGLAGRWTVRALDAGDDDAGRIPKAYQIEDSSDGTVWVVVGGVFGLALTHAATGTVVHEPYLLLSLASTLA